MVLEVCDTQYEAAMKVDTGADADAKEDVDECASAGETCELDAGEDGKET